MVPTLAPPPIPSYYPAAALATTGAGAAAATGQEPAPPTMGVGGGRIWGRGNKNTVAYPVPEQDMQKRVQSSSTPRPAGSAEKPDRITSRINVRIKRKNSRIQNDKKVGYDVDIYG